jgi:hypothetical protein
MELLEAINGRRSVREYTDRAVDDAVLRELIARVQACLELADIEGIRDEERATVQAYNCDGVVTLSEIGPIWTISQQAKSLKSLASTLAIVGKFRSV